MKSYQDLDPAMVAMLVSHLNDIHHIMWTVDERISEEFAVRFDMDAQDSTPETIVKKLFEEFDPTPYEEEEWRGTGPDRLPKNLGR